MDNHISFIFLENLHLKIFKSLQKFEGHGLSLLEVMPIAQSCNFLQVNVGVLIGDIQFQFCDFSPKQPHLQN